MVLFVCVGVALCFEFFKVWCFNLFVWYIGCTVFSTYELLWFCDMLIWFIVYFLFWNDFESPDTDRTF